MASAACRGQGRTNDVVVQELSDVWPGPEVDTVVSIVLIVGRHDVPAGAGVVLGVLLLGG